MKKNDEIKIYTVSELNRQVKLLLEKKFPRLWVEGEISNLRRPASGHVYFTLKDKSSQLPVVMFRDASISLRFQLEDGLQVVIQGRIAVYQKRGQYQLIAALLEPKGIGELQLGLEQLKKKLMAEGLFDLRHKKPLPRLPRRIGLVTSPTGAALRDILQVINRRFADIQIIINPVRVQGEGAGEEIARAIGEFNSLKNVDVLIVTRGGGSMEDLWAFNEEVVARSIFNSRIPVISAVGHQIDWTISDLVADLRAPTPSASAEIVVAQKSELEGKINQSVRRLQAYWNYKLTNLRQRLSDLLKSYVFHDPKRLIRPYQQRVDDLNLQLLRSIGHQLELSRQRLNSALARLESSNPLAILARGYSFTTRLADGKIIRNSRNLKVGLEVETRLQRGRFTSVVKKIIRN